MIKLTLPDGKPIEIEKGSTGAQVVALLKLNKIIAAEYDGKITDLERPIEIDAKVRFLTFRDEGGKHAFWHSSAHILAHAVKNLFPKAKPTIGPAIDQGFYYDFDDLEITQDDFEKIEKEMYKIINADYLFVRHVISLEKADKLFGKNRFKMELAEEYAAEGQVLTAYEDGDFVELCEGPHV